MGIFITTNYIADQRSTIFFNLKFTKNLPLKHPCSFFTVSYVKFQLNLNVAPIYKLHPNIELGFWLSMMCLRLPLPQKPNALHSSILAFALRLDEFSIEYLYRLLPRVLLIFMFYVLFSHLCYSFHNKPENGAHKFIHFYILLYRGILGLYRR